MGWDGGREIIVHTLGVNINFGVVGFAKLDLGLYAISHR